MPYANRLHRGLHSRDQSFSRFHTRPRRVFRLAASRRGRRHTALYIACAALFALYVLVLLRLVLLKHPLSMLGPLLARLQPGNIDHRMNLTPFVTIRQFLDAQRYGYLNDSIVFQNLAGNLIAFLPWGLGLPVLSERLRRWGAALAVSAAFILGIELTQLVTGFGIFDVDDILLNLAGAAIGFALWRIVYGWWKLRACRQPAAKSLPVPD